MVSLERVCIRLFYILLICSWRQQWDPPKPPLGWKVKYAQSLLVQSHSSPLIILITLCWAHCSLSCIGEPKDARIMLPVQSLKSWIEGSNHFSRRKAGIQIGTFCISLFLSDFFFDSALVSYSHRRDTLCLYWNLLRWPEPLLEMFWKVFFLLNNQFHTRLISGSKDPFKFPYNDYKQYLFFYVAVAVYIVWY